MNLRNVEILQDSTAIVVGVAKDTVLNYSVIESWYVCYSDRLLSFTRGPTNSYIVNVSFFCGLLEKQNKMCMVI